MGAGPPGILRIHHVGIVVRDAAAAAKTYHDGIGLEILAEEDGPAARAVLVAAGETLLHFIQPADVASPYAASLRDRGEGVHHVAFEVADLREAVEALAAAGLRILDPRPRRDFGDAWAVAIDPVATGGTLVELVQQIRTASPPPRARR